MMRNLKLLFVLSGIGGALAQATSTSATGLSPAAASAASSASAAAATASQASSTSNIGGKAFDNFYQIWLENTVQSRVMWLIIGL
jgi:hypothetical protein